MDVTRRFTQFYAKKVKTRDFASDTCPETSRLGVSVLFLPCSRSSVLRLGEAGNPGSGGLLVEESLSCLTDYLCIPRLDYKTL